jgi:hypothetical protein
MQQKWFALREESPPLAAGQAVFGHHTQRPLGLYRRSLGGLTIRASDDAPVAEHRIGWSQTPRPGGSEMVSWQ